MAASARLNTYQVKLKLAVAMWKSDEIGHGAVGKAVDGVAEGPADDQAERDGREPQLEPGKPYPERRDGHQLAASRSQRPRPLSCWNRP